MGNLIYALFAVGFIMLCCAFPLLFAIGVFWLLAKCDDGDDKNKTAAPRSYG